MSQANEPIAVLITAIGSGGHGEQILKALLEDKSGQFRILGADANPNCINFPKVEKSFILPFATAPDYLDTVLDICKQHNIKALFHGCEPELKIFSKNRKKIEDAGIFLPINPAEVIDICMNKTKTMQKLRESGFEPPKYIEANTIENLKSIDFYPVVIKPSIGGGGSANCYIAQSFIEIKALADYLELESAQQSFIIQEYVGTPDDEYTVGVLHDMDGNFINSIAVKRLLGSQLNIRTSVKNKTNRADLGDKLVISSGVSHGYVDRYSEVTRQCEDIAKAIGVKGPVNIQCRFVSGKVKVFEINPRFSGTTSIRAMMGYNEPVALLRKHLFNEPVETGFSYKKGWVLRTLQENIVGDLAEC